MIRAGMHASYRAEAIKLGMDKPRILEKRYVNAL